MYAKSPRIVQSANSYFSGVNFILRISNYFTEQDIILTRTEEGHEKD